MLETSAGYQNFGKKAYALFLSKWLEVPVAFLLIAAGASFVGRAGLIPVEFQRGASITSITCLAIAIISAVVCVVVSKIVFNHQEFSLGEDAFKLRQGVLRTHEIAIPYRQIQNVEIHRTLLQQMLGVSRLVISTGGEDDEKTVEDESRAILEDIDRDVATTLQGDLLRRADVQRVSPTSI